MSESEARTTECDVVVVGGGGTGLAAAIEAATLGREVVLIEKMPALGGTTAWSVGSITATSTPHQIGKGIKDTPQAHFDDMPGFAVGLEGRDNEALRRILTDNVPDTFRWLMGMGVEFFGPMPEPPHRQPRMHNVLPNAKAYIHRLAKHARREGVDIRLGQRARRLLVDDARVVGVACGNAGGETHEFRARGGVVLASGDFSASAEMKARYISPQVAKVEPINEASTGDGHAMAIELGARVLNGDLLLGPEIRFVPPTRPSLLKALPPSRLLARFMALSMEYMPQRLLRPFVMSFLTTALAPSPELFAEGAVLVNRHGERVAGDGKALALALADQPDRIGYIVFDRAVADKFSGWPHFISTAPGVAYAYLDDYRRNRPEIFHRADSLAALAAKPGMNAATLEAAAAESGARRPIETAPFYALGPVKSYVVFTDGGLAVDERLRVLDADDRAIAGLYAAGSAGQGGLLLEGHGHHIGWAFTSGRIAGRNAAYESSGGEVMT